MGENINRHAYGMDSPVLFRLCSGSLIMQNQGLISRLHTAGVIDKYVNELKFSDAFCKHLVAYNRDHGFNGSGTIEVWREILVEFSAPLDSLSDKDVATTIVLLDYFLDKLTTEKN